MSADSIVQALAELDVHGNGTISADDLRIVLQALDPKVFGDDTVKGILKSLDKGNTGAVKLDDFLQWLGLEATVDSMKRSGAAPAHVAIIGAGFVGTSAAFAMVCHETAARVTLSDVNATKCEGEVLDLEDGALGISVAVASLPEAGQADVIVITAGRGQKEGETRLDLIKANSNILKSVIKGMQPIKPSAKIIVVANPCDALTYVAQDCSGLPITQVFGSGTVLDSKRLRVALAKRAGVNPRSMTLYVLGEHGDSQFPVASLANIGGVPLLKCRRMQGVDLVDEAKKSAHKAYSIIKRKGYTAFGVGRAVDEIVDCVLKDKQLTLPVSVRVPGKNCCLSLPCVVGFKGIHRILEHVSNHFSAAETRLYKRSIMCMQEAVGSALDLPEGRMQRSVSLSVLGGPIEVEGAEDEEPKPGADLGDRAHTPDTDRLKGVHVAVIGAGFVGTSTAFALLCAAVAGRVTMTDVNQEKCLGEVLDLEDGDGRVEMATPQEAGQADIIVITAGRGQRDGETRLDLIKANAGIMKAVIGGMKPIKPTAKIIVVSNPCDALTYVAQECSGLPMSQVFGSGTVLDSRRLKIALAQRIGVSHESVNLFVLGEHGDSQFPAASLANVGGIPLMSCKSMANVDLKEEASKSSHKAYSIIKKKGYTAFGVARAIVTIVEAVVYDRQQVLPLSVRVSGHKCCLSLPCVAGINGIERILEHVATHFAPEERAMYDASIQSMEAATSALQL